jgi:hypothetical protein
MRTRVEGEYPGTLTAHGRSMAVITDDLSLRGARCRAEPGTRDAAAPAAPEPAAHELAPHELAPDDACTLTIPLAASLRLELEARVVRTDGAAMALAFEPMEPETYAHLRNMVRLLAPDADAIDDEQAPGHGPDPVKGPCR